jgi:hypothetical protein
MDALRAKAGIAAEDEGFTIEEYVDKYKVPYHTAVGQLDRMVRAGDLVQGKCQAKSRSGHMRTVNCYWPASEVRDGQKALVRGVGR